MKTIYCVKCGERLSWKTANVWEEGPISSYICDDCLAEENDFYEEDEDNEES